MKTATYTPDLRGFVEFLEENHPDQVIRIKKEVDPRFGVTGIIDRLEKDNQFPLVIFENVKGSSIPLVGNMHANFDRLRLSLGMEDGTVKEFLDEYHKRESQPIEPVLVDDGPVQGVPTHRTGSGG
jgi:UbiD family decarboxylase